MLKNYLKIALRNLFNNKIYSLISVSGIAFSIAACFLILNYTGFEISYDEFHENKNELYRITNDRYQDGELIQHGVITYPSVAKTIAVDYPEVLNYTRMIEFTRMYTKKGNLLFEENMLCADSAFFSMFSFNLILGSPETVLKSPHSVVLSETVAKKYFGVNWANSNILGETLNIDNLYDVKITGVFKDVPENSHMSFNIVMSYSTLGVQYGDQYEDSWRNSNFMSYIQLIPGADHNSLENKLKIFSEKYFKGSEVTGYAEVFNLQPISEIHLFSDYTYETWIHGSNTTINALLIIAIFIMVIVWVNFVNITTARSLARAKEVGIRKVIGAQKYQIIKQFLFESLLINFIGVMIAIIFIALSQNVISKTLQVNFSFSLFSNTVGILFISFFIIGTIFSGVYPAIINSSYKSLEVINGKFKSSFKGQLLRKGLVVFQFVLSFALISGMYAIHSQVEFMLDKDLGMNTEKVIVLDGPVLTRFDTTSYNSINAFKQEVKNLASVENIASSRRQLGRGTGKIFNIEKQTGSSDKKFTASDVGVDYDFFKTLGIKFLAGNDFNYSDHNLNFGKINSVVINRAATELFGFDNPQNAIGEVIKFWQNDYTIKGVTENYHHQSMHVKVEPIVFTPQYSTSSYFYVKLKTKNVEESITQLEQQYAKFFPGNSFSYNFLDAIFNEQYESDQEFKATFSFFAFLGVFLSCLGLFGLSFFTATQRAKEIGVRKVIGATTNNILTLLFKDFSKLIILATIISIPIAYWSIDMWLQNYAYQINLGWTMFLMPVLIVLVIATITVSWQTIKVALTNPVESLRNE